MRTCLWPDFRVLRENTAIFAVLPARIGVSTPKNDSFSAALGAGPWDLKQGTFLAVTGNRARTIRVMPRRMREACGLRERERRGQGKQGRAQFDRPTRQTPWDPEIGDAVKGTGEPLFDPGVLDHRRDFGKNADRCCHPSRSARSGHPPTTVSLILLEAAGPEVSKPLILPGIRVHRNGCLTKTGGGSV